MSGSQDLVEYGKNTVYARDLDKLNILDTLNFVIVFLF